MLIVDSLLISGIKFVLTRLAEAVEAEMYDETHLREELLAAQMKLELGEIDENEFSEIEAGVLAGLREIAERKKATSGERAREPGEGDGDGEGASAPKYAIESVEASFDHRDDTER